MAEQKQFVSRAGIKLAHALDAFDVDVTGLVCADFGCNVGGFTDCMLQRGAAHIFAIDTGYGTLAWKLRQDERITVMERTNALHVEFPDDGFTATDSGGVDLVTIDLGWTPQRHAIPAALRWLKQGASGRGRIITLIKPHYELNDAERTKLLHNGALDEAYAVHVLHRVLDSMPELGVSVEQHTQSPIRGGASKGKVGNTEFLAVCVPA